MLPFYLRSRFTQAYGCGLLLIVLFYMMPTYAQTISIPTASEMLKNLTTQVPNLMRLITAIAYVLGMYFIFTGLLKLKEYGEARTMMSQDRTLKGPMVYLVVGTLLIYLPTTVWVGMSTFWVNPNPYGYLDEQNQWTQLINLSYVIIQFIGTLAFIRGLVIMSHLGGGSTSPGTFSKGLTHIIGGILCINIYQFVQVIMVTLGIQT